MRAMAMILAAAVLGLGLVTRGADKDEPKAAFTDAQHDAVAKLVRDQVLDQLQDRLDPQRDDGNYEGRDGEDADLQPLPQTLSLEFKLGLGAKEEKPFSVMVAAQRYGLAVEMTSQGQSFKFRVKGRLIPTKDDVLLVTQESSLKFGGGDTQGEVSAEGSVLATFGKPVTLAQFGDKSLTLTINPAK